MQRLAPCERPTTPAPGNASTTQPKLPPPPGLPKFQRTSSGLRTRVRPEEMPSAKSDAPVFVKTTRALKMPSEAPPPRPPAPSLSEDVRIEISVPPPPLPAEPHVEPRIDRPTMPSARKQRRRRAWPLRIALMVLIVGGELALAQRSGLLPVPKDLAEARALFAKPAPAPDGSVVR